MQEVCQSVSLKYNTSGWKIKSAGDMVIQNSLLNPLQRQACYGEKQYA